MTHREFRFEAEEGDELCVDYGDLIEDYVGLIAALETLEKDSTYMVKIDIVNRITEILDR